MLNPNPWATKPSTVTDTVPRDRPVEPARVVGPVRPQPTTVAAPAAGLPARRPDPDGPRDRWWWLGCHGGAGVSTLRSVIGGAYAAGAWPLSQDRASVVLVARTHLHGLLSAQRALAQWASGTAPPGVEVVGLVLVADAPGTLPRPLADLAHLVAGGAARHWSVGWIEELRSQDPAGIGYPRALRRLGLDLARITERTDR